jgi:hypothetical protein
MAMSSSRALLRRIGGALRRRSFSDAAAGPDSAAVGYHVAGGPSYMRGAVFWEPGRPLTLEEFRMPRPKAGELLIKTKGPAFPDASPFECGRGRLESLGWGVEIRFDGLI